jgi:hypothetical protein
VRRTNEKPPERGIKGNAVYGFFAKLSIFYECAAEIPPQPEFLPATPPGRTVPLRNPRPLPDGGKSPMFLSVLSNEEVLSFFTCKGKAFPVFS